MPTKFFFRDTFTIDESLLSRLATERIELAGGDTLVIGAVNCTLTSLLPGISYVILAESLTTAPSVVASATPAVSVFATTLVTPFALSLPGSHGLDGAPGAPGYAGEVIVINGKPHRTPGGPGENGGNGTGGGPGGAVTIQFGAADSTPTATAPGGQGGHGGAGGAGGAGVPRGTNGHAGRSGHAGAAGPIDISQVDAGHAFDAVPADARAAWAAYRTEVGEYLFRRFDAASQLHALAEFDAALQLDPANTQAAVLQQRIAAQETPGGTARDLDMSPDYKDISAGLLGETQLVLSEFLELQGTETQDEIADATKDQFQLVFDQLSDRLTEAALDLTTARDGVAVADAERMMYVTEWENLQQQITDLQDAPLNLGDILTTLGAAATAIAGVVTGVGAIVSIPAALAVADSPVSGISKVLQFLADGKSFWSDKDVGGDLTDLLKGGSDAFTNFGKVYDEISGAAGDAAIKQLALQQVTVGMEDMVAQLRQKQARDQLAAAQVKVADAAAEVEAAQAVLKDWSDNAAFLAGAMDQMIIVARRLADMVAEDVFLARRALEIYQLADASDVRFDYGHLHPDEDHDLQLVPLQRVQNSLEKVNALPAAVITWNEVFVNLNEAQTGGFDIVHPVIEVVIDDAAALDHLRTGGGLQFAVGITAAAVPVNMPDDLFELKVDNLRLALSGASASAAALMWMRHSGHWIMKQRPSVGLANPPDAEFVLVSHVEAFNVAAGANPTAMIPSHPQTSTEPGPPFSFWGRGVLAEWLLFPDASATALDLSGLTEARLEIGCIGLVPHGAVTPTDLQLRPAATLLPVRRQHSAE